MGSFSNTLENAILDHVFGGGDYIRPATLYIALLTAVPDDTSTGSTITEANYTGYARKSVTNNAINFPAASVGAKSNGVDVVFAECTAGTSTITHFAIVDAATLGNVVSWGALSISKVISVGDTPKFATGDLDITLD